MASTPFFGKRESPVLPTRPSPHASLTGDAPAAARASDSPPVAPPVEGVPLSPVAEASVAVPGGSKLTVGPNIKLKGVEITDCDTLVVEGLVEATMDSRLMQIAEQEGEEREFVNHFQWTIQHVVILQNTRGTPPPQVTIKRYPVKRLKRRQ